MLGYEVKEEFFFFKYLMIGILKFMFFIDFKNANLP
jgi:hypothetical protein